MKKDITWNIRCLVDESFVLANQRTSVLYCKFGDFRLLFDLGFHKSEMTFTSTLCIVCKVSYLCIQLPNLASKQNKTNSKRRLNSEGKSVRVQIK